MRSVEVRNAVLLKIGLLEPSPLMWPKKSTENYLLDHSYCLRPGKYQNNRDTDTDSTEDDNLDVKSEQNLHESPWIYRADPLGNEYEANGTNQPLDPCSSKAELLITTPKAFGLKREVQTSPSVRVRLKKGDNTKLEGKLNGTEYKCSTCLYITSNRNTFRMHLSTHRLLNQKINKCDVILTKDNEFQCKMCNFKTQFIHRFKYHLKQHGTEVTSGDFSNKHKTKEAALENKGNDDIYNRFCCETSLNCTSENSYPPKSVSTLAEISCLARTEAKPKKKKSKHKKYVFKSNCPENVKFSAEKSSHSPTTEIDSVFVQSLLVIDESTISKKPNQDISTCVRSNYPEDVKRCARKPCNVSITEVGSIDKQFLLEKKDSTETKESNQMIEVYVLEFDGTENLDPLLTETFNFERSDPHKRASDSECCDLVTKYTKYLDMSQDIQINEIEKSAKRNELIKNNIQEECNIVPVKIGELFSKKVEDFASVERRSLDNQNVVIPQETSEPKEANGTVHDQINQCSREPSNVEPGDQSEKQLQDSDEHKSDSNKFKCDLCDFVSNYKKYLCLHMSRHENPVTRHEKPVTRHEKPVTRHENPVTRHDKPVTRYEKPVTRHEKPVKLRWHEERKKRLNKLGRRRRLKISGPIDMNKSYTGFKCYEKNCHFIANVKKYLDLHLEQHLKASQAGFNTVISKVIPNLVLKEQQQNTNPVYETLKGFKCNSCHFITNSKEYMELHIKEHQPSPELGRSENANVKNLDNPATCTTYYKDQRNCFSHDTTSDVCKPYRAYRCEKCDFSTHFIKLFKAHLDKHTTEALQKQVDDVPDNIPRYLNNKAICNKVNEKKDRKVSVTNLAEELDFPLETYNTICQIMDSEDCDIDNNQVMNDNGSEQIPEFDRGNYYRCEMCDFSTHFQEYLDLHVRKHACDIDKQSNFKVLENFHPTDDFDNETNEIFLKKEMSMWEKLDPYIHKTWEDRSDSMCKSKRSDQVNVKVDQLQEQRFSTIQQYWLNLQENNLESVAGKEGSTTKTFQCEYCNYTTKFEKNMTIHENYHILNRAYKCTKCKFSTNFTKFFEAHLESHIPNERSNFDDFSKSEIPSNISRAYKCKKCNFSTNFTRIFEAHLESHVQNDPERPNVSGSYKSEIPGNISKPDRPYKCKKCDFSTHFTRFFYAHLETHIPIQPEYVDMDCFSKIPTSSDRAYKCKKCDFSTHFIRFLEAHIEKHYVQEYMDPLEIHEEIK